MVSYASVDGHNAIIDEIRGVLVEGTGSRAAKLRRVAEMIRSARGYRWVGIYEVNDQEIAAVAWTGNEAPAHPRFPISQGLCGAAVSSGAPVLVSDVRKDPRYLTTFSSTRSEIVVPIRALRSAAELKVTTGHRHNSAQPGSATRRAAREAVLGLIDVESERVSAFTDRDRGFLEQCASTLAAAWAL